MIKKQVNRETCEVSFEWVASAVELMNNSKPLKL